MVGLRGVLAERAVAVDFIVAGSGVDLPRLRARQAQENIANVRFVLHTKKGSSGVSTMVAVAFAARWKSSTRARSICRW